MLANDSNEQRRQGGFSLLVNAGRGVAELMAECRVCGAITMYGLELAWRLHDVTCPECGTPMRLTERCNGVARATYQGPRSPRRAYSQRRRREVALVRARSTQQYRLPQAAKDGQVFRKHGAHICGRYFRMIRMRS